MLNLQCFIVLNFNGSYILYMLYYVADILSNLKSAIYKTEKHAIR